MLRKIIFLTFFILMISFAVNLANAKPLQQDSNPDGIVSVEAEHFDDNVAQGGNQWEQVGPTDGFTGIAGMQVSGGGSINEDYAANSPRLDYEVNFVKTGTHYIWVRAWGASGNDDSCHAGLDGQEIDTSDRMSGFSETYAWSNNTMDNAASTFDVPSVGVHTLNIWMREDGLIIDKIVLTTNPDYTPTDDGPPESVRGPLVWASIPNPDDETIDVSRDAILSWEPGASAVTHNVYFGTVFDDVNNADISNPLNVLAAQNQEQNTYDPGRLEFGQTYYWRIDEINNSDPNSPWRGNVWSFTAETFVYPIPNEMIIATASSNEEGKGPENTINGSGLDESGLLHGNISVDNMWLSSRDGNQPTWIEYEFDKIYKLNEMWVWNSNDSLERVIGLGCKDISIEYSIDGNDYIALGTTHEFAQAVGASDYAHNITIDFGNVPAKYVKLTVHSNWGGILNQYGLSEVRFFHIPIHAQEPSPDSGAIDVPLDTTLGWRAGREAAEHNLYFSDDMQAVIDNNALAATLTDTAYGPLPLDLGKTYYWRIDEVNNVEATNIWQGSLWDFTTQEYFVVDDFEDYNDYEPERIFDTWVDGYGNNMNGSTVGYPDPDFANGEHFVETTFVHEGIQSMPYFYDNSTAGNSEAVMRLSSLRDWTQNGIGTLSLWFRGNPEGFTEDPSGIYTITASGTDIWGTTDEFRYVFKQLSGPGTIIAKVESVENTDPWAKAGVMIRQTLEPDSKFAAVYITPGNGCRYHARLVPAADATSDTSIATDEQRAIVAPYWVKLERDASDNFNSYYSSDGANWQAMAWNPQNIPMPPDVYIGLALTSHNASLTCVAEISNVQTTGTVSPQIWTQQAIGVEMPSNNAEQMYVVLNENAAVYNDNLNASQIDDWTQWNINLQEFADQGVDLADVDTLGIGFGDRDNPQPNGTGLVYLDDIRLYPLLLPESELEPAP
ncbi:MAG: hypothetical protein PVH77_02615 [Phycisphaerales bacterium]|jgi:hypothetical protein